MKKFFLVVLLFRSFAFAEVDFSDFDRYQEKCTRAEIEEKLGLFLQKDGGISSYFSLSDASLVFYNAPDTNPDREVEYELRLASEKRAVNCEAIQRKDLVGVKIAIDPGHLGGVYAYLEDRFIDIPPSLERTEPIKFDEGTLSYLTAAYLKVLLEKEGAIVMVTRNRIGEGVLAEDFFDWLKKNPQLWAAEGSLKKLFGKYYNPLDLRARAKKINRFSPDLTIVIHYNSQDGEENKPSNHTVSHVNYNMVFVPGAFCRNELSEKDSRYEFLRLLVSEDLFSSLKLSRAVLEKFGEHLLIPPVSKHDGANYLNRVGLKIGEGIYARNLALTRLIHGPVCYGETLIQNNIDECVKLSRRDFVINGQFCSSRIKQVAEAYYEGIKQYFLSPSFSEEVKK